MNPARIAARELGHLGQTAARIGVRRATRGPRSPAWSFRHELFMAYIRARVDAALQRGGEPDFPRIRRLMDRGGDRELGRGRARFTRVRIAGMSAEWVDPIRTPATGVTLLYLHGGGYVVGSPRSHRGLLGGLVHHTGARVLALDYRLAPEHPCPAAIEDATAAWDALCGTHDPASCFIAGDSAGGGLTVATLVALRDAGAPPPAGAVLLSPWTDLTLSGDSTRADNDVDFLPSQALTDWSHLYPGHLPPDDPRVSPLFADLGRLPPLYVLIGGAERIADDGRRLVVRARAAGTEATLDEEPDEVHVFPFFAPTNPRADDALRRIGTFLASARLDNRARAV